MPEFRHSGISRAPTRLRGLGPYLLKYPSGKRVTDRSGVSSPLAGSDDTRMLHSPETVLGLWFRLSGCRPNWGGGCRVLQRIPRVAAVRTSQKSCLEKLERSILLPRRRSR